MKIVAKIEIVELRGLGRLNQDLDYKEIGRNIRYYRQKAGLKQILLSEMVDVSPQHISHIESGVKLSLPALVKIANALGVDTDSLLGNNLNKHQPEYTADALLRRTRNFSAEDYCKLIKVCDIFFS